MPFGTGVTGIEANKTASDNYNWLNILYFENFEDIKKDNNFDSANTELDIPHLQF